VGGNALTLCVWTSRPAQNGGGLLKTTVKRTNFSYYMQHFGINNIKNYCVQFV